MKLLHTTVSSQGQIFLPKELREKYNIEAGHTVIFYPEKQTITLKPVPKKLSHATRGMLSRSKTRTEEKLHAAWKKEWEKR